MQRSPEVDFLRHSALQLFNEMRILVVRNPVAFRSSLPFLFQAVRLDAERFDQAVHKSLDQLKSAFISSSAASSEKLSEFFDYKSGTITEDGVSRTMRVSAVLKKHHVAHYDGGRGRSSFFHGSATTFRRFLQTTGEEFVGCCKRASEAFISGKPSTSTGQWLDWVEVMRTYLEGFEQVSANVGKFLSERRFATEETLERQSLEGFLLPGGELSFASLKQVLHYAGNISRAPQAWAALYCTPFTQFINLRVALHYLEVAYRRAIVASPPADGKLDENQALLLRLREQVDGMARRHLDWSHQNLRYLLLLCGFTNKLPQTHLSRELLVSLVENGSNPWYLLREVFACWSHTCSAYEEPSMFEPLSGNVSLLFDPFVSAWEVTLKETTSCHFMLQDMASEVSTVFRPPHYLHLAYVVGRRWVLYSNHLFCRV